MDDPVATAPAFGKLPICIDKWCIRSDRKTVGKARLIFDCREFASMGQVLLRASFAGLKKSGSRLRTLVAQRSHYPPSENFEVDKFDQA
jgi:hypothetical protein